MSISQFILGFLAVTSLLSLVLIVLKGLRPEFESTAIDWIQTFGKLRDEIRKLKNNELPVQPSASIDTQSKGG